VWDGHSAWNGGSAPKGMDHLSRPASGRRPRPARRVQGELFPKTWADCYRCKTSFTDASACSTWWRLRKGPCTAGPFLTLSVSNYAAQVSWWFAHFPRSQFLFLTSDELHAASPVPVLNKILAFVGLSGSATPFADYMLRNVWGYSGNYRCPTPP
jgi:hypothetical protein